VHIHIHCNEIDSNGEHTCSLNCEVFTFGSLAFANRFLVLVIWYRSETQIAPPQTHTISWVTVSADTPTNTAYVWIATQCFTVFREIYLHMDWAVFFFSFCWLSRAGAFNLLLRPVHPKQWQIFIFSYKHLSLNDVFLKHTLLFQSEAPLRFFFCCCWKKWIPFFSKDALSSFELSINKRILDLS